MCTYTNRLTYYISLFAIFAFINLPFIFDVKVKTVVLNVARDIDFN
jgi:hypothetical protein